MMCVISLVPTLTSLDVLGPLFQCASLLRCKLDKACLLWRICTEGGVAVISLRILHAVPIPASKVTWGCRSYWDLPSHLFRAPVKQTGVSHHTLGKLIELFITGTEFDSLQSLWEG